MADSVVTPGQHSVTAAHRERPISTLRFDLVMGLLSLVFVSGVYLDGWAHAHGLVDRTFFTPWHAILYPGYLVNALVLVIALVLNHAHGFAWKHAMPAGYEVSLLGVPLFALAGIGDLGWHTLFGFEVNLETVLSPTHLLLAFSGFLIMGGPFRAAMLRPLIPLEGSFTSTLVQGWKTLLPMFLSLTALLSVFTFFTQFAHPFDITEAVITPYTVEQALELASILLQTGLLMGMGFLLIRRRQLPLGALTLIFTLNGSLMSVLAEQYRLIPTLLLAGIVVDLLLWLLKPQASRPAALRLFAFVVPVACGPSHAQPGRHPLDSTLQWEKWSGSVTPSPGAGACRSHLVCGRAAACHHWRQYTAWWGHDRLYLCLVKLAGLVGPLPDSGPGGKSSAGEASPSPDCKRTTRPCLPACSSAYCGVSGISRC